MDKLLKFTEDELIELEERVQDQLDGVLVLRREWKCKFCYKEDFGGGGHIPNVKHAPDCVGVALLSKIRAAIDAGPLDQIANHIFH